MSTLIAAVGDIVRSAYKYGFKRILIINGHGGNFPARNHLHEVNNDLPGLKLNGYDWWLSHAVEAVASRHNIKPRHANWLEAFPFTIVSEMPEGAKTPPEVPSTIMDAATAREVYGDGSFGGPYRTSDDIIHEIFAASLKELLQLLKFD